MVEGGVEHFHQREANPGAESVREVFHHRQCPDWHEGATCLVWEVYHYSTPWFQWPDMDVTRMDQSETIQMFKSKLRFQIRSWVKKNYWKRRKIKARRLPSEDKPGRGGYTEHPQLVQQVNWEWFLWNWILALILFLLSADGIFLNHLSQDIRGTNSSAVWRSFICSQPCVLCISIKPLFLQILQVSLSLQKPAVSLVSSYKISLTNLSGIS